MNGTLLNGTLLHETKAVICPVCMHHCRLQEGKSGRCRARTAQKHEVVCTNYGRITSLSLDPIEKKPLRRFYPGSRILSVGSYGCNLACPFCQNHTISMVGEAQAEYGIMTPKELVEEALSLRGQGNIGIAYTYNEPLVGYEFVRDCAKLAKEKGLKNVVVTNGSVEQEILLEILPFIDAFNVDLKGFTEEFYQSVQGSLATVLDFIRTAAGRSHVEVTTLVIPGCNDREEEIDAAARFLAGIDPAIPYHISRFFPQWHMTDRSATQIKTVLLLAETARRHLKYVYTGNCP